MPAEETRPASGGAGAGNNGPGTVRDEIDITENLTDPVNAAIKAGKDSGASNPSK